MLYLGACTGASPPICEPCGVVECDACALWMLSVKPYTDPAIYTQDPIDPVGESVSLSSLSFASSSQGSLCGSGSYLSEVLTFTDLSAEFVFSSGFSDVQVCGVRPYLYGSESSTPEYSSCDAAVDVANVVASVSGGTVTLSATSIALPTLAYWGGTIPAEHPSVLRVVCTATYDGVLRYVVIDLYFSWDAMTPYAGWTAYGDCVPACPTAEQAYNDGYTAGSMCGASEPPSSCPTEITDAYAAGFSDGWTDGACV
jgi:hypothetical protein